MGFLSNQAKKMENSAKTELQTLLIDGEEIENFYIVKEDYCCLTNKRLIFIDKSIASSKKASTGLPYNKISMVSLKKGGAFSLSKDVVITVSSKELVIDTYDLADALEIFKKLSAKIC